MKTLPADVLRKISLDLSPKDVLSLCLSDKHFNNIVCSSEIFWRNKIDIDYPKQMDNVLYNFRGGLYRQDPKKLYMIFSMGSKIVELYKYDYPELEYYITNDDVFETNEEFAAIITTELKKKPPREILKRGDVIHLGENYYRNDGKFIWDGNKVIILNYDLDEYGSVSTDFTFPEFRPDYFMESISHNTIINFAPDKIDEIKNNFDINTQQSYVTDRYNKYPIKFGYISDMVNIKFDKIIIDNDSMFEYEDGNIVLRVPVGISGQGGRERSVYRITFSAKWKESIVDITVKPKYQKTATYEWKDYQLVIVNVDIIQK